MWLMRERRLKVGLMSLTHFQRQELGGGAISQMALATVLRETGVTPKRLISIPKQDKALDPELFQCRLDCFGPHAVALCV